MSETSGFEAPRIVFTNANLAQSAAVLRSPEWHSAYAQAAGYDSVEYHPLVRSKEQVAWAVKKGELALNSLHQSFRTNALTRNTNAPGGNIGLTNRLIDSPAGRLLMPEMRASAKYIGHIEEKLERRVPVVLYPQADLQLDAQARTLAKASETFFQPTDHVARLINARDPEEFYTEMFDQRGYDGLCLDTFHARRRYGGEAGVVSRPAAFNGLLEHTRAVHLSVGRSDLAAGEPHIDTESELQEAIDGKYSGYVRDVLDGARVCSNIGYIVVEAPIGSVRQVAQERRMASPQVAYQAIAEGLHEFFAAA